MSDERKINQLIKEAELNIRAGDHKEAEHRLYQAWARAHKYTGASMYRIESDKIAEIWDARNTLSIMRQLCSENSIHESTSERRVG